MATVNKDFKIKSGLIVEGTTATVNGFDVLTKKQADQDYIVGLIGGTATSANTANTVVKRDANGNFAAGTITANLTGNVTGTVSSLSNHDTADLAEGTNLYFTNARAISATAASYDAAGTAATEAGLVAGDLADHESDTSVHGVTGNVVGTSDTQTLTNKTIGDTLNFTGAGAMTINSDSHIVLTPAAGSSVKWGSDILATRAYADQAEADAISTAASDATSKANAALSDAEDYTDAKIVTEVTNRNNAISTAIGTEVTNRNSAISSAISTEVSNRNTAISTAVSNLVDGAPALLDTLNELAEALGDSPSTITNLTTLVGTKAPLASPALTGVPTAPTAAADTSTTQIATTAFAKAEADAAQAAAEATAAADATSKANAAVSTASADATSKANAAQAAAISSAAADATSKANAAQSAATTAAATDATTKANAAQVAAISAAAADATSKANAAQAAAIAHADALDTDDVEEGSSQYFTDARAKASAAALLTGATKTNITITGTGAGLVITAENGVADSTTSDLAEGSNLYFTNARAVSAVQAVVPNFTSVDLNSVAKQVAATLSAPTAGIQTAHAFAKADYRSAEYLVKVAYGTHTEISKVLLTLDTSDNIAITEYGIVGTNGSASSVSAGISGANVQLQVTTINNNSTVTVMGTLLK
jgi:hypothetical protein